MTEKERPIFREGSLRGLSTPERLDQLLRIVRPQSWLLVLAVGLGLVLAVLWAIFGRIPSTATGTAILVRPKQVVPFQSPAGGPVASIEVRVGDLVEEGDVIARLRLPGLEKELESERAKLELFELHADEMTALEVELAEERRDSIREQREMLDERIGHLEASAELYKDRRASYLAQQRDNLKTARDKSRELGTALEARFERAQSLVKESINSEDTLVEPRADMIDNELTLAELEVQEQQLELEKIKAEEEFDARRDLIQELKLERQKLLTEELAINRSLRERELTSTSDREAIARRIEELQAQLERESRVLSPHTGRVLEVTTSAGQRVTLGERMGKLEIDDPSAELMAIAYFQIKDGKKLRDGLEMRVSPSTVERERFGSMKGEVVSVSDYPVTIEAAANQIGDLETARTLLGGSTRIEVVANLASQDDTFTGFAWTSGKGPENVLITAGTTAEVRVTIEEIRPITLVLPFLKSLLGA